MNDYIQAGDYVKISFTCEHTPNLSGEVLYAPCATGDCWHIRGDDRRLHYVMLFQEMTKLEWTATAKAMHGKPLGS